MSMDDDAIDLVRYAISDTAQYWRQEMSREDASNSVRKLLAELITREPTNEDVDAILG